MIQLNAQPCEVLLSKVLREVQSVAIHNIVLHQLANKQISMFVDQATSEPDSQIIHVFVWLCLVAQWLAYWEIALLWCKALTDTDADELLEDAGGAACGMLLLPPYLSP